MSAIEKRPSECEIALGVVTEALRNELRKTAYLMEDVTVLMRQRDEMIDRWVEATQHNTQDRLEMMVSMETERPERPEEETS